ncbi:MAG: 16S rRNA (adenine(1518)-N(6)/adenine(1519)-N(6))-dimethyltransferase RsmA [Elusimicrobiota bacterium]
MGAALGQHYLIDSSVVRDITIAVAPVKEDVVFEIGPGRGVLTEPLLATGTKVVAVEIDPKLTNFLRKKLRAYPNLELVNDDVMRYGFTKKFGELKLGTTGRILIAANLPYYISTPIIRKVLSLPQWAYAVIMVQNEVGQRMCAAPGSKRYGILSIATQAYASTEIVRRVPAVAFKPVPKVESIIVKLTRRATPLVPAEIEDTFFAIVHAAFGQRRKTLANTLDGYAGISKDGITQKLTVAGIDPSARAETLSIEQFILITKTLHTFVR